MTSHIVVPAIDPDAARHPEPPGARPAAGPARATTASSSATPSTWPARPPAAASPRRRCCRWPPVPTCSASAPDKDVAAGPRDPGRDRRRRARPAGWPRSGSRRPSTRIDRMLAWLAASRVDGRRSPPAARRARGAVIVEGELPDLRGAEVVSVATAANIAVGEVPWGLRARPRRRARRARDRRPARSSCRCATRTGDPRSWSTGAAVVVEWGWPGPYDGSGAEDLHAWLLPSGGGRGGRTAEEGGVGPVNVGLDIGATKTLGLVVDDAGAILAEVREATEPGADGVVRTAARVVEALRAATGEAADRHRRRRHPRPGRRRARRGQARGQPRRRRRLAAARRPARPTGSACPVVVENDVNAATLGAVALSGADDLVYLSIGTGLAAGLVLDGRLRRGEHGAAGEIGHVPVDPQGVLCQCGQRGCLETIASGSALAAAWPSGDVPPAQALFAAAAVRRPGGRSRPATGSPPGSRARSGCSPRRRPAHRRARRRRRPARRAAAGRRSPPALLDQAATSPFLASLDLAGRLRVVPVRLPGRRRRRGPARPMSEPMTVPGLVDLQVNGAAGIDLTAEPHRLWEVAAALPAYGVVAFVPTVITSDPAARRAGAGHPRRRTARRLGRRRAARPALRGADDRADPQGRAPRALAAPAVPRPGRRLVARGRRRDGDDRARAARRARGDRAAGRPRRRRVGRPHRRDHRRGGRRGRGRRPLRHPPRQRDAAAAAPRARTRSAPRSAGRPGRRADRRRPPPATRSSCAPPGGRSARTGSCRSPTPPRRSACPTGRPGSATRTSSSPTARSGSPTAPSPARPPRCSTASGSWSRRPAARSTEAVATATTDPARPARPAAARGADRADRRPGARADGGRVTPLRRRGGASRPTRSRRWSARTRPRCSAWPPARARCRRTRS